MLGACGGAVAAIPWPHLFFGPHGAKAFSVSSAGNLFNLFMKNITGH